MYVYTRRSVSTIREIATRRELLNVKQVGWMVTPNSRSEQATKEKEASIHIPVQVNRRITRKREGGGGENLVQRKRERIEKERKAMRVARRSHLPAFSIFHDTRPFRIVRSETRKWKIQPRCLPGCFMKFNKYEMNLPCAVTSGRAECMRVGTRKPREYGE